MKEQISDLLLVRPIKRVNQVKKLNHILHFDIKILEISTRIKQNYKKIKTIIGFY